MAATLDFIDAVTRQSIHKSRYAGSYSVDKASGLDKLIEDVVLDEALADAVKAHIVKGGAATP